MWTNSVTRERLVTPQYVDIQPKMLSETPQRFPVALRQHKKSRTGCKNCKTRKVKCDEIRPICGNCYKYYANAEVCEYEDPLKPAFRAPARSRVLTTKTSKILARPTAYNQEVAVIERLPIYGGMDPFTSYPTSHVPNTQFLMHHYLKTFESRSVPIVLSFVKESFLKQWWKLASSDELLFHATLALSAFDINTHKTEGSSAKNTALLGKECVRLLRQRIEEAPNDVSDCTIQAVLSLIIIEFERGNFKAVKLHVSGVQRMVSVRGGLLAIRRNNIVLANMIFGTTTIVTGDSVFPPEPDELADMLAQCEERCPPPIITDFENWGCSPLFSDVIRQFQYNIWMVDNAMLNAEAYFCTGRATQQLRYLPAEGEEGTYTRCVCESMRWACTLAAFLPFARDYPNPTLYINSQVHKLRESLTGLVKCAPSNHALLPWLFSVGAVVALPTERSWFVNHLVSITEDANIRTYEQYRASVSSVIWVTSYCARPFRKLWEDFESQRLLLEVELW